MHYARYIEMNPRVMLGKPVIRGTRITVELIVRQLAQGKTIMEILTDYPHLKKPHIYAAMDYAANLVEEESSYALPTRGGGDKAKDFAR